MHGQFTRMLGVVCIRVSEFYLPYAQSSWLFSPCLRFYSIAFLAHCSFYGFVVRVARVSWLLCGSCGTRAQFENIYLPRFLFHASFVGQALCSRRHAYACLRTACISVKHNFGSTCTLKPNRICFESHSCTVREYIYFSCPVACIVCGAGAVLKTSCVCVYQNCVHRREA